MESSTPPAPAAADPVTLLLLRVALLVAIGISVYFAILTMLTIVAVGMSLLQPGMALLLTCLAIVGTLVVFGISSISAYLEARKAEQRREEFLKEFMDDTMNRIHNGAAHQCRCHEKKDGDSSCS